MTEKPPSGLMAMLAGAVLIVLGMLVVVEPRILVWLAGSALVLFGIALLMIANFLRRLGAQARNV
jgi:uncharacterized membrane protein HdeD (DUF308 family)